MNKKTKWILITSIIIFAISLIVIDVARGYCNETIKQVCDANQTSCNSTITKSCVNELNEGHSGIALSLILGFLTATFIFLFISLVRSENPFFSGLSFLFLFLGLLFPLFIFKLLRELPDISSRLQTLLFGVFKIYLIIYIFLVIIFMAYIFYMLIVGVMKIWRTPHWEKKK